MQGILDTLVGWLDDYTLNISFSFVVLLAYTLVRRIAIPRIEHHVETGRLKDGAFKQASTALNLLTGTLSAALIMFIWGFDFRGLLAFSTGLIALTGAALFASWSILSNVTSFFLLLLHPSYRRGNFIRVVDADNYVEGYISEINLFNTKLISEQREVIIYPNNLLMARPTLINPKNRFHTFGKTQQFALQEGAVVPDDDDAVAPMLDRTPKP